VTGENWHEERDRIADLLNGIESGAITHVDEDGLRQLQALDAHNLERIKERLATLNERLGSEKT
jgi:hypothetical protein